MVIFNLNVTFTRTKIKFPFSPRFKIIRCRRTLSLNTASFNILAQHFYYYLKKHFPTSVLHVLRGRTQKKHNYFCTKLFIEFFYKKHLIFFEVLSVGVYILV